jgi:hypothetical protein
MKPFRRTILIMPFLLPEALPARTPYSRVVIIPPQGFNSQQTAHVMGSLHRAGKINLA